MTKTFWAVRHEHPCENSPYTIHCSMAEAVGSHGVHCPRQGSCEVVEVDITEVK